MLPVVSIGGYQGIGNNASSFDYGRNYQGQVNVTKVTSAHTLRGGADARLARRIRTAGGNPSGSLGFTNEFTRQASDTSQLTPSNLGLSMAAFMLGIPSTATATIQQEFEYSNHFLAGYGQDSWRMGNLTLNLGLRFEWEDGIKKVLSLEWDRMIPGHPGPGGRLGTRDDVNTLLSYMQELAAEVKKAADAGKCIDTAMREVKLPKYATLTNYENWLPMNVERYCLYYSGGM